MKIKRVIQRFLFVAFWLGVATVMVMLLVAGIGDRNREKLRSYTIEISGGEGGTFLTPVAVEQLLQRSTAGVKGELLARFQLRQVEQRMEKQVWIRDVQLYFDNQDVLHVKVQEKIPLARLFTVNGGSCYLDDKGRTMPLSLEKTMKVPVFTNLPDSVLSKKPDSLLLDQLFTAARLIAADSFWSSQIAQLDRDPMGQWELVPVVGDHTVKLGELNDLPAKLRRLLVFYEQVLSKAGLGRYRVIDVRFAGQVVAGSVAGPRVDSLQLRRSVEKLLQAAQQAENDTVVKVLPKPLQPLLIDEVNPGLDEMKKVLPGAANTDTITVPLPKNKKSNNN